jgi:hypothetical protein
MPRDFEIIGPLRNIEEIEDGETEISDCTNRFAICIDDADYLYSLTTLKVYPVINDSRAEKDGWIRIIDDSREDYLYITSRFVVLTLAAPEASALLEAMRAARTADASSRCDDSDS